MNLLDWLNFFYTDNKDFLTNATITMIGAFLIFSIYSNTTNYYKIQELNEKISYLKRDLSSARYDNTVLNSENLSISNKLLNYKQKCSEYENIYDWNHIFNKNIYTIYHENELLNSFMYFDYQTFLSITAIKTAQITYLEYNTFTSLYKLIYSNNTNNAGNIFNYLLIKHETQLYFNKIRYLYLDTEINNLLFKGYGNTYPFYKPYYTPLKNIISDNIIPYSLNLEYYNK